MGVRSSYNHANTSIRNRKSTPCGLSRSRRSAKRCKRRWLGAHRRTYIFSERLKRHLCKLISLLIISSTFESRRDQIEFSPSLSVVTFPARMFISSFFTYTTSVRGFALNRRDLMLGPGPWYFKALTLFYGLCIGYYYNTRANVVAISLGRSSTFHYRWHFCPKKRK